MTDLDEIMAKDPLDLTDADIDAIIEQQRKHQALLGKGGKAGVKKEQASGALSSILDKIRKPKAEAPAGPKLRRI